MAYRVEDKQDLRWNDSLYYLQYLNEIETNISALLNDMSIENLKILLSLLNLYMIYLFSVIRFDRTEFDRHIDEIALCIRRADLNQDGKINADEMALHRTEILGALTTAREMFIALMCLKVDNGLSLDIKKWKKEMRAIAFYKSIEVYIDKNILYGYKKICPRCREGFEDEDTLEAQRIHESDKSDSGFQQ